MPLIITREMAIQFVKSQQRSGFPVDKQLLNLRGFFSGNRRVMSRSAKLYIRRKLKALNSYCPPQKAHKKFLAT